MGLFKNAKDAMGQANDAMAAAQQAQQQYGGAGAGMGAGNPGLDLAGRMADRGALESQAHEQNRILSVGGAGTALIRGHVDAGEQVAGNPVWIFDLEVTPEGGASYTVSHREIVSSVAIGSYGDGTSLRSDELKELKEQADAQPKTSMLEGVKTANQAMKDARAMQAGAAGLGAMDPNAFAQTYTGGIAASATVNAINDTGTLINNAPVCELDLTVTVPGREPYRVTHRQLLAQSVISRYQPGAVFSVRVDQNDPTKLVIG
jgi:hypothetical protein